MPIDIRTSSITPSIVPKVGLLLRIPICNGIEESGFVDKPVPDVLVAVDVATALSKNSSIALEFFVAAI